MPAIKIQIFELEHRKHSHVCICLEGNNGVGGGVVCVPRLHLYIVVRIS